MKPFAVRSCQTNKERQDAAPVSRKVVASRGVGDGICDEISRKAPQIALIVERWNVGRWGCMESAVDGGSGWTGTGTGDDNRIVGLWCREKGERVEEGVGVRGRVQRVSSSDDGVDDEGLSGDVSVDATLATLAQRLEGDVMVSFSVTVAGETMKGRRTTTMAVARQGPKKQELRRGDDKVEKRVRCTRAEKETMEGDVESRNTTGPTALWAVDQGGSAHLASF
ncbi:hypothetical protein BDN70DRAFT_901121 [Pholiota conissans]|uniref:Uncharacterized protein n=1 Tax=Pholiota conissans TaxID=109636 RepID=A0A9P6CMF8_9AGAR|nr:hypothetical protein BDN70DRAFT_901121 [Pholiota conissans]